MKKLFLFFCLIILGLLSLPFFMISNQPLVTSDINYNAQKMDQAKAFVRRNDPRRLAPGELVTQWFDEEEISLAGNYFLDQVSRGALAIELHPGRAYGQVTVVLPENPIGEYVNATVILSQSSGSLVIESLSLGQITIPRFIAEPVQQFAHTNLLRIDDYQAVIESLNGMQLLEDRMLVMYQWNPALVDRLKDKGQNLLVDEAAQERLIAYSRQIEAVTSGSNLGREVSLTELIGPVFLLAEARGGDPVEENRAALLALSFYFSGVDIARLLGVNIPRTNANGKKLTLYGRHDFAQHFLTSAALTVASQSSGFADSVGLFKELDDAKGGSGFSFTDIGADRAGVRVAELAIANASAAGFVQAFLANSPAESDFMPDVLDLPELMPNDQFVRDYGSLTDPRYLRVIKDIEERLDKLPIFRHRLN